MGIKDFTKLTTDLVPGAISPVPTTHPFNVMVRDVNIHFFVMPSQATPEQKGSAVIKVDFDIESKNASEQIAQYEELANPDQTLSKQTLVLPQDVFKILVSDIPESVKRFYLVSDDSRVDLPLKELTRAKRKEAREPLQSYDTHKIKEFTDFGYILNDGTEFNNGVDIMRLLSPGIKRLFFKYLAKKAQAHPWRSGLMAIVILEGVEPVEVVAAPSVIIPEGQEPEDEATRKTSSLECHSPPLVSTTETKSCISDYFATETDLMIQAIKSYIPEYSFAEADLLVNAIIHRERYELKSDMTGIFIDSHDSDIPAIAVGNFMQDLAHDKFHVITSMSKGRYLYVNELARYVHQRKVSPEVWLSICILMGTDFFEKGWTTDGIGCHFIYNGILNSSDYLSPEEFKGHTLSDLERLVSIAISAKYGNQIYTTFPNVYEAFKGKHKKGPPIYLQANSSFLLEEVEIKVDQKKKRKKPEKDARKEEPLLVGMEKEEDALVGTEKEEEEKVFKKVPFEEFVKNLMYWQLKTHLV